MKVGFLIPLVAMTCLNASAFADTSDAQTGLASYYADSRQDVRTSTGEHYDPNELTAAHSNLPLGSWVRVTNLDNGRSIAVRINDRNAPSDRIIDLSKAAAQAVGMIRAGLAYVSIERITAPLHYITMHEPPRKPAQH